MSKTTYKVRVYSRPRTLLTTAQRFGLTGLVGDYVQVYVRRNKQPGMPATVDRFNLVHMNCKWEYRAPISGYYAMDEFPTLRQHLRETFTTLGNKLTAEEVIEAVAREFDCQMDVSELIHRYI